MTPDKRLQWQSTAGFAAPAACRGVATIIALRCGGDRASQARGIQAALRLADEWALGVVARAKGMTQIASQTGLSREQLYRSFSAGGNPTLRTTLTVMKALGIELTAKPAAGH